MKRNTYIIIFLAFGMLVYGQQTGRVGVNTEQPEATLDVRQKGESTTNVFMLRNSQDNHLVTVQSDGKVGIGTDSPTATLDVNGYVKLGSTDTEGDASPQPGMIRFNTTTQKFQGYTKSSGWIDLH